MMLFAGAYWFESVPGATETGPFNPHFVQDIGAAFLTSGLALAVRAWRPVYWPAAVAGAGFLAAHGLIHLVAIVAGHDHHAVFDVVVVVLPSALALYSALPDKEKIMRSWFARRLLRRYSQRYGYDTGYLEMLLKVSPAAFFKFAPLMKASRHREVVPIEASFAAGLTGAKGEDCGPCAQLVVDMALEAGVARDQIEAVVRRDVRAMNDDVVLAFRFADAIVRRSDDEDEHRDAVRAQWGQKGVIDLSFALQMGRMFPMMKTALGYAKECRRISVDGKQIDVVKQAA
ncbi:MAG TPA: hypothetical protein VFL62_26870 [Bradyrhizobium sp.]|uniref:hypothetical protein n=1 Tax=Bradyrhizobium sp. TaxID=376 RepID=UPI002D7F9174|nr:hypothetical protein [Bradyrhizobium sp.]HET7889872.1 hypothetical protein [Bradyrhizobium sp.]